MQILKFVQKERPPFVTGMITTTAGAVPRVATAWSRQDQWGMVKSRVSAFRMAYTVEPGFYAVGAPTKDSEVFVTANYKLTFDIVRRSLAGLDAWVLVLDTKSINVWCAAGKGTFGSDELVMADRPGEARQSGYQSRKLQESRKNFRLERRVGW